MVVRAYIRERKSIHEIKQLILTELSSEKEMATPLLAQTMGYTKVTDAVSKAVRELLDASEIKYTEPDNPRSRNQKLRLVDTEDNHD